MMSGISVSAWLPGRCGAREAFRSKPLPTFSHLSPTAASLMRALSSFLLAALATAAASSADGAAGAGPPSLLLSSGSLSLDPSESLLRAGASPAAGPWVVTVKVEAISLIT